jgi:hypothetical protein
VGGGQGRTILVGDIAGWTFAFRTPAKNGAAQDAYSICAARVCDTGIMASQAIQEVDQIGFLLVSETDREALIVEVHYVL